MSSSVVVIDPPKQVSREDIYAPVEDTAKIMDPSSNIKNTSDTSGVSTALNEWTVEDTRQWLQWAAVSQDKKYLDPVLTALEKAVDGGGRNENEDISKRKRKRTAGQVVQVGRNSSPRKWTGVKFISQDSSMMTIPPPFPKCILSRCGAQGNLRNSVVGMLKLVLVSMQLFLVSARNANSFTRTNKSSNMRVRDTHSYCGNHGSRL